jgi:hypothetical protein
MHNASLSFLIYLLYFKNSELLNCSELDPCVYDVFDSESALELNSEVVTLTPGTPVYSKDLKKKLYFTEQSQEADGKIVTL